MVPAQPGRGDTARLDGGVSGAALVASLVGYIQTSAALKTADRRFREQREAVDNFFTRVSENTLLDQPGLQPLRKELLGEALKYYQGFLAEQTDDPTLRDDVALAHYRVGSIAEEIDSPAAALDQYATALGIQRELVEEDPASSRAQGAGRHAQRPGPRAVPAPPPR